MDVDIYPQAQKRRYRSNQAQLTKIYGCFESILRELIMKILKLRRIIFRFGKEKFWEIFLLFALV